MIVSDSLHTVCVWFVMTSCMLSLPQYGSSINIVAVCVCVCVCFIGTRDIVLSRVDLIICIGGDGTILYTASLFKVRIYYIIYIMM